MKINEKLYVGKIFDTEQEAKDWILDCGWEEVKPNIFIFPQEGEMCTLEEALEGEWIAINQTRRGI